MRAPCSMNSSPLSIFPDNSYRKSLGRKELNETPDNKKSLEINKRKQYKANTKSFHKPKPPSSLNTNIENALTKLQGVTSMRNKNREELIRSIQDELDRAECLIKQTQDHCVKRKESKLMLKELVIQVDKFLVSMHKLQRAVAKNEIELIPKLKDNFEKQKLQLETIQRHVKSYYKILSKVNLNESSDLGKTITELPSYPSSRVGNEEEHRQCNYRIENYEALIQGQNKEILELQQNNVELEKKYKNLLENTKSRQCVTERYKDIIKHICTRVLEMYKKSMKTISQKIVEQTVNLQRANIADRNIDEYEKIILQLRNSINKLQSESCKQINKLQQDLANCKVNTNAHKDNLNTKLKEALCAIHQLQSEHNNIKQQLIKGKKKQIIIIKQIQEHCTKGLIHANLELHRLKEKCDELEEENNELARTITEMQGTKEYNEDSLNFKEDEMLISREELERTERIKKQITHYQTLIQRLSKFIRDNTYYNTVFKCVNRHEQKFNRTMRMVLNKCKIFKDTVKKVLIENENLRIEIKYLKENDSLYGLSPVLEDLNYNKELVSDIQDHITFKSLKS